MKLFRKIDRRADMMSSMAEKVGVDWSKLVTRDPEMAVDYRSAVLTCFGCQHEGACVKWQALHESSEQTPRFCPNSDRLTALRTQEVA